MARPRLTRLGVRVTADPQVIRSLESYGSMSRVFDPSLPPHWRLTLVRRRIRSMWFRRIHCPVLYFLDHPNPGLDNLCDGLRRNQPVEAIQVLLLPFLQTLYSVWDPVVSRRLSLSTGTPIFKYARGKSARPHGCRHALYDLIPLRTWLLPLLDRIRRDPRYPIDRLLAGAGLHRVYRVQTASRHIQDEWYPAGQIWRYHLDATHRPLTPGTEASATTPLPGVHTGPCLLEQYLVEFLSCVRDQLLYPRNGVHNIGWKVESFQHPRPSGIHTRPRRIGRRKDTPAPLTALIHD